MRRLLLFAILLGSIVTTSAQDIIMTVDAEEIVAKVEEVSDNDIRYRRHDQPNGPMRTIATSKVFRIKYANGSVEMFKDKSASTPTTTPAPSSARRYNIGDIYNEKGLLGVVVDVDISGVHGLIMHPYIITGEWCHYDLRNIPTQARDRYHGQENMRIIGEFLRRNGFGWEAMPLFAQCRAIGEGWYIPSYEELTTILSNINGAYDYGTYTANAMRFRQFNDHLVALGFDGFIHDLVSSTEYGRWTVYCYEMHENADIFSATFTSLRIQAVTAQKTERLLVTRPVHRF
ncbi:MAG: hypothetical protein IKD24_05275 [Alistipes sp.]|nr:hypothetical protein [Alistipes sp.]